MKGEKRKRGKKGSREEGRQAKLMMDFNSKREKKR